MNKIIQEIRRKLYLNRDGASASSMKEKGINYKLNLGVPVYLMKEIAQSYFPNSELADTLWKEEIRELKIMATLIQDPEKFEKPEEWVENVQNTELAEQLAMNLLSKLPYAGSLATQWIKSDRFYFQLIAFLIYIRLFRQEYQLAGEEYENYFHAVFNAVNGDSFPLKNAALNSLKCLGEQSVFNSPEILAKYENLLTL